MSNLVTERRSTEFDGDRDMAAGDSTALEYLPRLPRDKSVGIGCIGTGFIMADCHLVAYRQAGFRPVAIAARDCDWPPWDTDWGRWEFSRRYSFSDRLRMTVAHFARESVGPGAGGSVHNSRADPGFSY